MFYCTRTLTFPVVQCLAHVPSEDMTETLTACRMRPFSWFGALPVPGTRLSSCPLADSGWLLQLPVLQLCLALIILANCLIPILLRIRASIASYVFAVTTDAYIISWCTCSSSTAQNNMCVHLLERASTDAHDVSNKLLVVWHCQVDTINDNF